MQNITTVDLEVIENTFEVACGSNLQITHRLELRRLVTSFWYDMEIEKVGATHQNNFELLKALKNFRANLQRRKKSSDTLTSLRLMAIPELARAILLSDIAYTFRGEIDDYTQIDFGNAKHEKLLKAAVSSSISKVANKQGRPVNQPLDDFFIGLRDLYEKDSGRRSRYNQITNRQNRNHTQRKARPSMR